VDRAIDLIQARAAHAVLSGSPGSLARWVDLVGAERARDDVRLAIAAAWLAIARGDVDGIRRWIAVVEAMPASGPLPDGSADSEVAIGVVRAMAPPHGIDGVIRDTEMVRAAGGPPANPWWATATAIRATVHAMCGERALARTHLAAAIPLLDHVGFEVGARAHLALLDLDGGEVDAAAAAASRAVELADRHNLRGFLPAMAVYAVGSLTAAIEGRMERSRELAVVADGLIARLGDISTRTALLGQVTLARAALDRGDRDEARERTALADRLRRREPGAPALNEQIDRLQASIGGSRRASDDHLTPAELRVLSLLPTHLSLKEIADQLVVSRNTVKTHSVAIHRKLGVTSRSDAVAEARRRSLLRAEPRVGPAT
jgi:LuxR family maltose regulon positive regulatory protein